MRGGVFTARQDYFTHLSRANRKVVQKREIPEKNTHKQNLACLTCDPSKAINKTISEILGKGNDIRNMHFRVASFECRHNNSQENTKFRCLVCNI